MKQIRKRITYANVTSLLALVVSLGAGTAWAAGQLAPKSVGTAQLRTGAVTADKLRKSSVTAEKIKSGAIGADKIASGAVVAAKIAAGAVGTDKIVNGAITPEKVPDDSLTGTKVNEATLSRVPSAANTNFAGVAGTANPEAFAQVTKEGNVVVAASKGIGSTDVGKGEKDGIYCVNVPGFAPRGAQATPLPLSVGEGGPDGDVSAFVKFGVVTSCPANQIEVRTYNNGVLEEEPFYFMAYR